MQGSANLVTSRFASFDSRFRRNRDEIGFMITVFSNMQRLDAIRGELFFITTKMSGCMHKLVVGLFRLLLARSLTRMILPAEYRVLSVISEGETAASTPGLPFPIVISLRGTLSTGLAANSTIACIEINDDEIRLLGFGRQTRSDTSIRFPENGESTQRSIVNNFDLSNAMSVRRSVPEMPEGVLLVAPARFTNGQELDLNSVRVNDARPDTAIIELRIPVFGLENV